MDPSEIPCSAIFVLLLNYTICLPCLIVKTERRKREIRKSQKRTQDILRPQARRCLSNIACQSTIDQHKSSFLARLPVALRAMVLEKVYDDLYERSHSIRLRGKTTEGITGHRNREKVDYRVDRLPGVGEHYSRPPAGLLALPRSCRQL